jgi:hypothetical protein
MIRAVYHDGKIEPVEDLPAGWQEGQSLEIRAIGVRDAAADADDWINERGAFAHYEGQMPEHVRAELARRVAEFEALGPAEWEPGEQEKAERFLQQMDDLSRRKMQQLGESA